MTQFRIPARLLQAAALFASTDGTRYVLNGVHVEIHNERVLLVATDGRRLLVINATLDVTYLAPEASEVNFILPTALWPLPKCGKEWLIIAVEKDSVAIASESRSVMAKPIDANYPSWRQVIPNGPDQSLTCLNVNGGLLETFFKVSGIINPRAGGGLRISQKVSDTGPYLIKPDTGSNWMGVLMPIRATSNGDLPLWLNDDKKPATES